MAAFKAWARSEKLEINGKLEQFRGTCIAFDAEDYLNTLLTGRTTREPLLPALGGLPFALQSHVEDDLLNLENAGIKPLFVFNGLQAASKSPAMVAREAQKAAKTLDGAWGVYDQGQGVDSVAAFGRACTYRTEHILRWLLAFLDRFGVTTQTAPVTAAAQLVFMENNKYADTSAGSASSLLFGADKVITAFNWETKTVSWVDAELCRDHLSLNEAGFADLMLLSGCIPALLPALSQIDIEDSRAIQTTRSLLAPFNGDGHALLSRQPQPDKDYLEAFKKARIAVKHAAFLNKEGFVELREADTTPTDMHLIHGSQLPPELMCYLSRGLASARVLNWIAHGQIFESPPLDGGDSQAYRDLVQTKLVDLRTRSLAVIATHLHRYYQNAPITLTFWFDDASRIVSIRDRTDDAKAAIGMWHVREAVLPPELLNTPLTGALRLLADDKAAKATVAQRGTTELESPAEVLGNTVFRFMQDTGFVDQDHTLSVWGKAVKTALDRAQQNGLLEIAVTYNEVEQALFLAFQLLKMRILNTQQMFPTPPFSGPPLRGSNEDKANVLLISRVASLGFLRHSNIGYTGPLSRHLLAYHQIAASVRQSLRDLLEMHACSLFMSGAVKRISIDNKGLTALGSSLPFLAEPDLGLALVVKSYLDELSNEPGKRADISKWFSHVTDMEGDLQKAWKLWDCVNAGVQGADEKVANEATKKMFRDADEWLLEKRQAAKNGVAA